MHRKRKFNPAINGTLTKKNTFTHRHIYKDSRIGARSIYFYSYYFFRSFRLSTLTGAHCGSISIHFHFVCKYTIVKTLIFFCSSCARELEFRYVTLVLSFLYVSFYLTIVHL